jgi:hypothetical protein
MDDEHQVLYHDGTPVRVIRRSPDSMTTLVEWADGAQTWVDDSRLADQPD